MSLSQYYGDRYHHYEVERDGKRGFVDVFDGTVKAASLEISWTLGQKWEDIKEFGVS